MKKSLLVLGLVGVLVSNVLGNEPVRTRKNLVEVSTEDIVLEVSEVVLEEIVEVSSFEFLFPTLEITEVVLEEVQEVTNFKPILPVLDITEVVLEDILEEDFIVLQSKCDKCNKCNK